MLELTGPGLRVPLGASVLLYSCHTVLLRQCEVLGGVPEAEQTGGLLRLFGFFIAFLRVGSNLGPPYRPAAVASSGLIALLVAQIVCLAAFEKMGELAACRDGKLWWGEACGGVPGAGAGWWPWVQVPGSFRASHNTHLQLNSRQS